MADEITKITGSLPPDVLEILKRRFAGRHDQQFEEEILFAFGLKDLKRARFVFPSGWQLSLITGFGAFGRLEAGLMDERGNLQSSDKLDVPAVQALFDGDEVAGYVEERLGVFCDAVRALEAYDPPRPTRKEKRL